MEWSTAYKSMKELEAKTMMDMALLPNMDQMEFGVGSSEKENASQVMKPRKKSMTSLYLKFFETTSDGKSRKCKFCKQSYSISTATGNLRRHLNHHHPGYDRQGDAGQQLQQSATAVTKKPQPQVKPATVDFDHVNLLLVKWLIGTSLPPSTIEDETLVNIFRFLNSSVKIWSIERMQSVTLDVFKSMRDDVRASLEHVSSKVSIALDFWTSCEQVVYMSVKGYWIDENWSLHKVLLGVSHIPYPCGGPEIFLALLKVLKLFNIEKRILSCTLDSSSDNSQPAIHACFALKEELDARKGPFCYIPCAAQTLNLIIEDGLKTLRPMLIRIREFVREMNASLEIAQDFKQMTAAYNEGSWKLPLDTSAHWTGDYAMLDIVRKAPNSMDIVIRNHEEALGGKNLLLNATEKSLINFWHLNFEPFYKITTNLCTCKVRTIGLVLLFMDHVFEIISAFRDSCRQEWLKTAADDMAERARNFSSIVYNPFTYMAAVLDPRIKKDLIPENLKTDKNLEEARNHFSRHYSTGQFTSITNGYSALDNDAISSVSFAEEIARKRRRLSSTAATDELTQYLSEPPVPIATDVLDWWKVNSTRYPRLSVMARDYLAVQGTSVEPEELFSSKGDDIQRQRFCLPHNSMQSIMCIQSWVQSGYTFKFRSKEVDFEKLVESISRPDTTKNEKVG
uniref:Putative AC9 transposase n=1 Tax=Anthurium amnicola TaxID=1678845 RepID=A0A1D1YJQ2_9ARAE